MFNVCVLRMPAGGSFSISSGKYAPHTYLGLICPAALNPAPSLLPSLVSPHPSFLLHTHIGLICPAALNPPPSLPPYPTSPPPSTLPSLHASGAKPGSSSPPLTKYN